MKNSTVEVERLEPLLTGGMLDLAGSWVCILVVGRRWLVNMVEWHLILKLDKPRKLKKKRAPTTSSNKR